MPRLVWASIGRRVLRGPADAGACAERLTQRREPYWLLDPHSVSISHMLAFLSEFVSGLRGKVLLFMNNGQRGSSSCAQMYKRENEILATSLTQKHHRTLIHFR